MQERKKAEYRSSIRSKIMIKEALLALMVEKPFEKISITDVVKRADINRGTFYAHFSSIGDVLKNISSSVVEEIASACLPLDVSSVFTSPEKFLITISGILKEEKDFYSKLLKIDKFNDVLDDTRHLAIKRIISDLSNNITPEEKRTLTIVLDYAISGIMNIYEDILLERIPISLDESTYFLCEILKPQRSALEEIIQHIQK